MDLRSHVQNRLRALAGEAYASKYYLVGVSGGKDSICLLHLAHQIIPSSQLRVIHVNYQLRGKDSLSDEKLVQKYCKQFGIEFLKFHPKVENSSEEHLRNLRRFIFNEELKKSSFDYLLLAHHAQDQLETLLMRLIRGTGLEGLGAMKEKNGRTLRPLLQTNPKDILTYVKKHRLNYHEDQTNFSTQYFRNEVRHELIPIIEKLSRRHGGESAFYEKISALTKEIRKTTVTLQKNDRKIYKRLVSENELWFRFPLNKYRDLKAESQIRLLRLLLKRANIDVDRKTLTKMQMALKQGKDLSLPKDGMLSLSCDQVFLQNREQKKRLALIKGPLCLGMSIDLPNDMELRFPLPGDRFGTNKLKKRLLEERIPKLMRRILPVLARRNSHEVVWYLKEHNFPSKKD